MYYEEEKAIEEHRRKFGKKGIAKHTFVINSLEEYERMLPFMKIFKNTNAAVTWALSQVIKDKYQDTGDYIKLKIVKIKEKSNPGKKSGIWNQKQKSNKDLSTKSVPNNIDRHTGKLKQLTRVLPLYTR